VKEQKKRKEEKNKKILTSDSRRKIQVQAKIQTPKKERKVN
jgi:hypothetical protein